MKVKRILAMTAVGIMTMAVAVDCGSKTEVETEVKETKAVAAETTEKVPEDSQAAEAPGETETQEAAAGSGLQGKRIGVAALSMYDEWCTAVRDEFLAQQEEFGIAEVNVQDGNYTVETQQKNIEDFISKQYDAILVDVIDGESIKTILDKAEAAGIPVLAYDAGTDWDKLVSYVAWDHAETGKMTADWVADYAKENLDGKVKVGMLISNVYENQKIRGVAFKEELEKVLGAENVEYVFEQDFAKTREGASNVVTNNIAKPIDVIWGCVDNAAFGATIALSNANKEDVIVVSAGGWGAEPFNAINDNDPYYKGVVGVPPAEIVKYSYQALADHFDGKEVEKNQNIPLVIIDSSNIEDYMKYVTQ